ncbi:hypothetical protein BV133_2336 [Blastochloris viridis]|nr:hypothetical protein BV133_2336 [Blastochloris viridis]
MFLVKVAFWLAVLVLLIPTGGDSSHRSDQVGAGDAMSAAYAAVDDLRGFCGRQPEVCEIAGRVGSTFTEKAQVGAKMLYEFLKDQAGDHGGATVTGSVTEPAAPKPEAPSLAPDEMQMPWRGPENPPRRRS